MTSSRKLTSRLIPHNTGTISLQRLKLLPKLEYTKLMKTKVYFDGACHLCSREIEHYRKHTAEAGLEFIDIAHPAFSARAEGLDPVRVNREMHVRDVNGKLHYGVDAFIELWRVMPGYARLSKIAKLPWINPFLQVGYHAFAKIRPYLPKKKGDYCDTGACDLK